VTCAPSFFLLGVDLMADLEVMNDSGGVMNRFRDVINQFAVVMHHFRGVMHILPFIGKITSSKKPVRGLAQVFVFGYSVVSITFFRKIPSFRRRDGSFVRT
jgi:hypothetical protein